MPSMDALIHAIDQMPDHDYVVCWSPLLRCAREDIDATVEKCHRTGAPTCVTMCHHRRNRQAPAVNIDAGWQRVIRSRDEP